MSREFEPERMEVEYRGKPLISVRGLSLVDISHLMRRYFPQIKAAAALLGGPSGELFLQAIAKADFVMQLFTEFPEMAADLIRRACDDYYDHEEILKFPLSVQLDAASKIIRLTLEDAGGPKQFAVLIRTLYNSSRP